jgi:hypothetical protein
MYDRRRDAPISGADPQVTTSKRWTLVAAVLGSSIVFLDSAVLPVALRAIGR